MFDSFLELLPALGVLLALSQVLSGVQATCIRSMRLFGALDDRYTKL
jgi:hypothetical protein